MTNPFKKTGKKLLAKSLAGFQKILNDLNTAIELDTQEMEAKDEQIGKLETEVEMLFKNQQHTIKFRDRLSELIGL